MEVRQRIEAGDERARKMLEAMCYNIAKQIGAMGAALEGKVDGILLTGGIAYNEPVVEYIRSHCSFIAPVTVYPGENELESLAINALVVLRGAIEGETVSLTEPRRTKNGPARIDSCRAVASGTEGWPGAAFRKGGYRCSNWLRSSTTVSRNASRRNSAANPA